MDDQLDYVARCEHGTLVCWLSGKCSGGPKFMAKEVAKWMRWGLSINRMTTEQAKKEFISCDLCEQERAQKKRDKKQAKKATQPATAG